MTSSEAKSYNQQMQKETTKLYLYFQQLKKDVSLKKLITYNFIILT